MKKENYENENYIKNTRNVGQKEEMELLNIYEHVDTRRFGSGIYKIGVHLKNGKIFYNIGQTAQRGQKLINRAKKHIVDTFDKNGNRDNFVEFLENSYELIDFITIDIIYYNENLLDKNTMELIEGLENQKALDNGENVVNKYIYGEHRRTHNGLDILMIRDRELYNIITRDNL